MQILLVFLFAVLVIITLLIIKFMQGEEREKKTKLGQTNDMIVDLESKLKRVQEELGKELAAKEEIEGILYKTKDEADTAKNAKNELEQKIKELTKEKDDFTKKAETLKQLSAEKQGLQSALEAAQKETEEAKKQKENLEKELASLKSELSKKDSSLKQLTEEKEKFRSEGEAAKKEIEQLRNQPPPVDAKEAGAQKEALQKENEELKNKLKFLEEIHEGFKGQYDELSKQLEEMIKQKIKGVDNAPATDSPLSDTPKENEADAKKASSGQEQENPQTGSPENNPSSAPLDDSAA